MSAVSFLLPNDIAEILHYRKASLKLYFSEENPEFETIFTGFTKNEIHKLSQVQLQEADLDGCLKLLSSIEAIFRRDYKNRCKNKRREDISKELRKVFKKRGAKARLNDDILNAWKDHIENPKFISDLKGAFKYRNWLAHGRHWVLKSKKYDFNSIYELSQAINDLPLIIK